MTAFPTVRVAAIQSTPVILDAEGCVEKVERLHAKRWSDSVGHYSREDVLGRALEPVQ